MYSPLDDLGQTAALGGGAAAGGAAAGGAASGADAAAGTLGGGDFMALFNRMGGLDGILSTMGKVQKMVSIFRQFGPVFKLFGGGFGLGGLGGQLKTASVKRRPQPRPAGTRGMSAARPGSAGRAGRAAQHGRPAGPGRRSAGPRGRR